MYAAGYFNFCVHDQTPYVQNYTNPMEALPKLKTIRIYCMGS